MPEQGRLELSSDGSPIRHHTTSRIVSGATLIQVGGKTLMLDNMTEPSEDPISGGVRVNVLHLDRPLEWVMGGYNGGQVQLTIIEEQTPGRRNPYVAAGFTGKSHFLDIINHEEFTIVRIFYNAIGPESSQVLYGCRVIGTIKPSGNLSRETTRRMISFPVGYTYKIESDD